MKRKKQRYPLYVESKIRSGWGDSLKPDLPFSIKDVFQSYRDSIILNELVFAACNDCKKPFSIRARFSQKELFCSYCGGSNTSYIEDRGKFLFRLASELAGYLKVEYLREKAEDDDKDDDKFDL